MSLFDLKALNTALTELQEERGISKDQVTEAISTALAAAYRKEYGKGRQIIRCTFSTETGDAEFEQAKIVVDDTLVRPEGEDASEGDDRSRFNPDQHIMIDDARRIKRDVEIDQEITFPLETREDFGRIAAMTAKQVIIQKLREAERSAIITEFGAREGEIVTGSVQRFERGNLYIDIGRSVALLPYDEQIPGERFRQGERVRALLFRVDEGARGAFIKLSRSHPKFLAALFEQEVPELQNGTVQIKSIAREPGSRAKVAVVSNDSHVDPVGALVGQRGTRVSVITSELGGEKIDIIEWSEDPSAFVSEALKPAHVMDIKIDETDNRAEVFVSEDQQSLAIGRGGQNVRLAARLTGWKIDIKSLGGNNENDDYADEDETVSDESAVETEAELTAMDAGIVETTEPVESASEDATATAQVETQ
jgi:transcription termination/antitermination protein NusA